MAGAWNTPTRGGLRVTGPQWLGCQQFGVGLKWTLVRSGSQGLLSKEPANIVESDPQESQSLKEGAARAGLRTSGLTQEKKRSNKASQEDLNKSGGGRGDPSKCPGKKK